MYGIDLILPQIQEVAGTFSCLPAISAAAAEFTRAISMTFIDFPIVSCKVSCKPRAMARRRNQREEAKHGCLETWLP